MVNAVVFLGLLGTSLAALTLRAAPNPVSPPEVPPAPAVRKPQLVPGKPLSPFNASARVFGGPLKNPAVTVKEELFAWQTITAPTLAVAGLPPAASTAAPVVKPVFFPRPTGPLIDAPKRKRVSLPTSVDWRNYGGVSWVTTAQNQGSCESCWVFSATALIESMVRIEHGAWGKRSEADLHDQLGVTCLQTGDPTVALNWAANAGAGVADPQCDEYYGNDKPYLPCGDRSGRAVRIPQYSSISSFADQKAWIASTGPLSACFNVYADFRYFDFSQKKAWHYNGKSPLDGGHCILIVGYDDQIGGWLIKNSWGSGWGNKGFGYIAYGTAQIDNGPKYGLVGTNPDPWLKRSHHNGLMFESGNGASHRNFELFRSDAAGGIQQIFRSGEAPFAWGQAGILHGGPLAHGQPATSGTSFDRDFHVLYVGQDGSLNEWYYSELRPDWYFTSNIGGIDYLQGYPGMVQTDDSSFSVVVRTTGSALYEYRRNVKTGRWSFNGIVATAGVRASGPSLVQSNVKLDLYDPSTAGNLYVVAVLNDGSLQLYQRAGDPSAAWVATERFGAGVPDTPPVMIQDFWRTQDETSPGGFQLLVAVNGVVQHWQRINTDINTHPPVAGSAGPWQHVRTFGSNIKHVWSLAQGSFAFTLDAIVEDYQGGMWHWRWTNTWTLVVKIPGVPGG